MSKAALESGEGGGGVKDEVDDDEFAEVVGKTTEDILDEIDNLMADNDDEEDEEADPGLVTSAIFIVHGKRACLEWMLRAWLNEHRRKHSDVIVVK